MDLNELVKACHQQAVEMGWADHDINIIEQVALLHSECSEALEAWRNNEPISWTDGNGKPQGVASEYADIIIRLGHYIGKEGIDIEYEINRKLEYNVTRGHRHGGKKA